MKTWLAYLSIVFCFALILFVCYINIDWLIENFGNGPPYYGRTTNMDKWGNPIPTLIVIDIGVAIALSLIGKWAFHILRGPKE